jgi:lysylphosphatidylglycerol synthetase-like protein (DUF2156 family)
MPNLMPDWLPWIHPAGRLLWSLILTGVGLAFVVALIQPPLEHKILTAKQTVQLSIAIVIGTLVLAKFVSAIQTVWIWAGLGALFVVAMAGVMSRNPRSPDQKATWSEAMLGSVAVFGLFTLAYGVVPHEWLTFANSYLNMSSDRFIVHPLDHFAKLPFSAVRDIVATVIYGVFFGMNLVLWSKWQHRLDPKPEQAATEAEAAPRKRSIFGRPVKAQG